MNITNLEQDKNIKKKTLSFAGAWKDIDDSVFDDLTKNLINNRRKNRKRIDE